MLILNVLYEFPAAVFPDNPHAEVHEFTVEFSFDPSRPPHDIFLGEVVHDTRVVSFADVEEARLWLAAKHFARLDGYHPITAEAGEAPYPSQFAIECWVFQPGVATPDPTTL